MTNWLLWSKRVRPWRLFCSAMLRFNLTIVLWKELGIPIWNILISVTTPTWEGSTPAFSPSICPEMASVHPSTRLCRPANCNLSTFHTTKYPTTFSKPSSKPPTSPPSGTSTSTTSASKAPSTPSNNFYNTPSAWSPSRPSNAIFPARATSTWSTVSKVAIT